MEEQDYVNLCLGDTGAMTGHGLPTVLAAIASQAERGITTMLPTEDSIWLEEELARRLAIGHWLFTLRTTNAKNAALRIARQVTGRGKIMMFSYCYYGSVDEKFAMRQTDNSKILGRATWGSRWTQTRPRSRSSSTTSASSRRP